MSNQVTDDKPPKRLVSLDQFRGYTVLGMFIVNFLGSFAACPRILKHTHDYCSYADTIMPQFLFAVGFSLRLTYGRKFHKENRFDLIQRMVRRILGLLVVALLIYTVNARATNWEQLKELGWWGVFATPLKREWFQTLTHIAITSLWVLPVIPYSFRVRLSWLIVSSGLHVALSYWFNFEWVNTDPRGIDGGPLGFLTWSIPALLGSIACDWYLTPDTAKAVRRSLVWASAFMLMGYILSCGTRFYDVPLEKQESLRQIKLSDNPVVADRADMQRVWQGPIFDRLAEAPFVPPPDTIGRKWNYWMMSQRSGSLSYLVFSAGFSLGIYVVFFWLCDRKGWSLHVFRTLGTNALLGYVVHELASSAIKPFVPKDSPGWFVFVSLGVFLLVTWNVIRHFEKQGIYWRV